MRRARWLGIAVLAADSAFLLLALWVAWLAWLWWRPHLDHIVQVRWTDLLLLNEWMPPASVLVVCWLVVLRQLGFYDPERMTTLVRQLSALTRSIAYVLMIVVTVQFFVPQRFYSRVLVVAFLGAGFFSLASWRWLLLKLQTVLDLPIAIENVAIYGTGESARLMAERIARHAHRRYNLVGFIASQDPAMRTHVDDEGVHPSKILGGIDNLREIVNEHDIETIVLASRVIHREEALMLATRCDHMGLRVLQVPFTWGIASPRIAFANLGELQLIDLSQMSYPTLVEHFKRAFDLVAVSCGLLVLAPVFLVTAIAVYLDDPGPVFYAAPRAGRGGRAFPFFKYRSMVVNADKLKDQLREQNESDGLLFKIKDDPRITRVGRFIRKYSVDELPQFWNVVRGDMNLVGPRPLPMKDLENIGDDPEIAYWFEMRHKVSPGITGLWQVSGRSNLGFKDMVELDIQYIQNWSFWLDIKILLITLPAVLKGRGAA
jgi:exopolysaccharide biosynthesis polyprenyl glycosylphosphotransferase